MTAIEELERTQGLLASEDIAGLLARLRARGEALPMVRVAGLVAEAAQTAGFGDLVQAAAAVAGCGDGASPQDVPTLQLRVCVYRARVEVGGSPRSHRGGRYTKRGYDSPCKSVAPTPSSAVAVTGPTFMTTDPRRLA
jgi:hypothetical protein